jgi:hypothetical protein
MIQSNWRELLNRKEVTWPAIAALWIALFHLFGYVAANGKTSALGVYDLARPAISQEYVISGLLVFAQLGLQSILLILAGLGIRAIARRLLRRFPPMQTRLASLVTSRTFGWLIVILAVSVSLVGAFIGTDLVTNANALILKPAAESGSNWTRINLDPDAEFWLLAYLSILACVLTIFIRLSYWIVINFIQAKPARVVYSIWAILQTLNIAVMYAFVFGAGWTIQPYPVVTFSNQEQHVGKNALTVLLGSDEREFAFLVSYVGATQAENPALNKTILYLPRSEVKWMHVVGHQPLQVIAYYRDWKLLLPASPASK